MKCQKCGKEIFLPFKCPYCKDYFCPEHHLPENHECPRIELARAPKIEAQTMTVQQEKPYEYTVTYTPSESKRKIHFSYKEIEHLTVAALLVMAVGLSLTIYRPMEPAVIALFTLILTASFLMHEIAHKIAAQRRGLWAEFRLTLIGALLTLISVIPILFKIISPGAVMIGGFTDKKGIGKISIAGPLTNIILSAIFFMLAFLSSPYNNLIFVFGAAFNAWIALFNLIPFGIFDGFKVFMWNKVVWALAFSVSLVLTLISYPLI